LSACTKTLPLFMKSCPTLLTSTTLIGPRLKVWPLPAPPAAAELRTKFDRFSGSTISFECSCASVPLAPSCGTAQPPAAEGTMPPCSKPKIAPRLPRPNNELKRPPPPPTVDDTAAPAPALKRPPAPAPKRPPVPWPPVAPPEKF
jgi:hypothetical protein